MSNNSLNNYIATDPTLSTRLNSINSNYASDVKKLESTRQQNRNAAHIAKERLMKYIPEILASRGLAGNVAMSESSLIDANNEYNNTLSQIDSNYSQNRMDLDATRDANISTLYNEADTKLTTDRNNRYSIAENTIKNWSGTQEELNEYLSGLADDDWGEGMYDSLINSGNTWKDTQAKNDQNSAYDTAANIIKNYSGDYTKGYKSVYKEIEPLLDRMNADQKADITASLNVYDQKYQSNIMLEAIEKIDNSDSWSEMMEIAASTSLNLSRVNAEALRKYVDEYGENIAATNSAAKITADEEARTAVETATEKKRLSEIPIEDVHIAATDGIANYNNGQNFHVVYDGVWYNLEVGDKVEDTTKKNAIIAAANKNTNLKNNNVFGWDGALYIKGGNGEIYEVKYSKNYEAFKDRLIYGVKEDITETSRFLQTGGYGAL